VDCAEGRTPPPAELRLAWMCGDHSLPASGGVLDQEYQVMHRMRSLDNIYNVVHRLRNLKGEEIHSLTDTERRIIRSLRDMKVLR
jgi:hypothetical protein